MSWSWDWPIVAAEQCGTSVWELFLLLLDGVFAAGLGSFLVSMGSRGFRGSWGLSRRCCLLGLDRVGAAEVGPEEVVEDLSVGAFKTCAGPPDARDQGMLPDLDGVVGAVVVLGPEEALVLRHERRGR